MAEQIITTGSDAYVASGAPASNYAGSRRALVKPLERYTLLHMPVSVPTGRTVLSAVLSGVARVTFPGSGQIGIAALSESWKPSRATWNNQPATTGAIYYTAVPTVVAGARFELDVTELVQAIALGQPNYGWRLTTDIAAGIDVRSFEYGGNPWVLTIETSDVPTVPSDVSPRGMTGKSAWVCRVEDYEDLVAIQVRVDASMTAPYDWQSAQVATTVPQLDLATAAGDTGYAALFPGLAEFASTNWQVRVKMADGAWSPWSDWQSITRHPKPTLVIDTPVGPGLYDPTPRVTAHLEPAGTADTTWRVVVTTVADPTEYLYDSGDDISGATLEHVVPLRFDGHPVIDQDGDYRVVVQAWDDPERVPSFGDPTWVRDIRVVTLDADPAVNAPTTLAAEQYPPESPRVRLTWTRGGTTPDRFVIRRNDKNIAIVDAADVEIAANTWRWVDEGASPHETAKYTVRAWENGSEHWSPDSPLVQIYLDVKGVWLLTNHGDVVLYGDEVGNFKKTDKRTTYALPYNFEDVDIITAIGGMGGTFEGAIDNREWQDVDAARSILEAVRQDPDTPVQMVWATQSRRVYLRGPSVAPSPDIFPDRNRRHLVSFEFFETRDD